MRDPMIWSIPLGRLFGINIKVHILYPVIVLGLMLRYAYQRQPYAYPEGTWIDFAILAGLALVSVFLHELGHCFAARRVDGEAHEVLIWPLGGLATVDVPHTARAHFLTAAAGPAVNFVLCVLCALLLAFVLPGDLSLQPPWSPRWYPFREPIGLNLVTWSGAEHVETGAWAMTLARLFWVNWMLFWLNMILVGYPMDAGRMLQAALWPRLGYASATRVAVFTGFITMFAVAIYAIFSNELLALCLAGFIYVACRNQWLLWRRAAKRGSSAMTSRRDTRAWSATRRHQLPRFAS